MAIGVAGYLGGDSGVIQLGAINPMSGSVAFYGELATKTRTVWADRLNEDIGHYLIMERPDKATDLIAEFVDR